MKITMKSKMEIKDEVLYKNWYAVVVNEDWYEDNDSHEEHLLAWAFYDDEAITKSPFKNTDDQKAKFIIEGEYNNYDEFNAAGWFDELAEKIEKKCKISYIK